MQHLSAAAGRASRLVLTAACRCAAPVPEVAKANVPGIRGGDTGRFAIGIRRHRCDLEPLVRPRALAPSLWFCLVPFWPPKWKKHSVRGFPVVP